MFNKITLIGRLQQHADAKTAQNNREYVFLSKGDRGLCLRSSASEPATRYQNRRAAADIGFCVAAHSKA